VIDRRGMAGETRGVSDLEELLATVARLRGPGGCPWDQEQTHQTLTEHLLEECAELIDTIDRADIEHMREELGDVLLQVVLHAQIAQEAGDFDFEAVARDINAKLIRRHPHVFGEARLETSAQVLRQWDQIKAGEKAAQAANGRPPADPLAAPPARLPALLYARDVYKRLQKAERLAAIAGIDRAAQELAEGLDEAEAGRRLFALAAACRRAGVDPEAALRREADRVRESVGTDHGDV